MSLSGLRTNPHNRLTHDPSEHLLVGFASSFCDFEGVVAVIDHNDRGVGDRGGNLLDQVGGASKFRVPAKSCGGLIRWQSDGRGLDLPIATST